jgi:5-methylcytosine-specific restriction endonuclease McrA
MAKSKPKWNQEAAIRGALRRIFSRSPVIWEVLRAVRRECPKYNQDGSRSKRDAVQYQCNVCQNWVGSTKVAVDHINPVVSVDEGFVDFNTFIQRLFCDANNLQVICDECHDKKTYAERIGRLLKQYGAELDKIEQDIKSNRPAGYDLRAALKKYTSKKKTNGLAPVADRAETLLKNIPSIKGTQSK